MSTATPATTTGVHQSFWSKAATWLLKIGGAIKTGLQDVVNAEPKIASAISVIAPTVEGISNILVPGSGSFEQHLLDVYGFVAKAVADGGAAVNAVSISTPAGSLALDEQIIADIKAFLPAVQAFMHPGATSAVPAPAVTPAKS